ncbi:MAG: lysophospholipase [Magnetococcus sp. YQC-3]
MSTPSLLDHPLVLRTLFHPREEPPFVVSGDAQPIRIQVAEDIWLGGRLHVSGELAPSLLFWHGNGEIAADYDDIASLYTGMGINFLIMDYRGYGLSDGRPTGTTLLADAMVVYDRVREVLADNGIGSDRLYVMGRSLGSAAAIEIAAQVRGGIAGLVIESGFAFTIPLLEQLGGLRLEGADETHGFGNQAKMAQVSVPVLLIHGEEDEIIPVGDAHALFTQVGHGQKRLLTVPHAGHNDLLLVGQRAYFAAIRGFVLGE